MKLSYRGNSYETETSLLEITETEIMGKYRGHTWKHKLPQHIPQLQPKMLLQYRGVAYSTSPQIQIPAESSLCTCIPMAKKYPQLLVQNTEQIHLENLRRNLIRRLELAKVNGNQNLVDMLQKECQQLKLGVNC